MNIYKIVVIPGDGIGPEIVESSVAVLQALEQRFDTFRLGLDYQEAGAACYIKHGTSMTPETFEACRKADAILKGPVGLPNVRRPDGTEAGSISAPLRNGLDLYANVRPIKLYPGVTPPLKVESGKIDYVIVRENTEGLYLSRGLGLVNRYAASDTLLMTRHGVERIVRFAFEMAKARSGAPEDKTRRVTCVAKTNVLKSHVFFASIFDEIAEKYPGIETEHLYPDADAAALVANPEHFDVLVMENFLGDILSDLGGATIGGLGMCPSGDYGEKLAYFEPSHGSAPTIAGKGVANPLSQILSSAMMLHYIGEHKAAVALESAVVDALKSGDIHIGSDGRPIGGTRSVTQSLLKHIQTG